MLFSAVLPFLGGTLAKLIGEKLVGAGVEEVAEKAVDKGKGILNTITQKLFQKKLFKKKPEEMTQKELRELYLRNIYTILQDYEVVHIPAVNSHSKSPFD